MITRPSATIEDLYHVRGKAEIVNCDFVYMSPTGIGHGRAAFKIATSLAAHEEEHGGGYAVGDNVGFVVRLPNRLSFSLDAAWYVGNVHSKKFAEGAPLYAVEVRSPEDYGPAAERAIAAKIADYFAAGTLVVWDVDLEGEDTIRKHTPDAPGEPQVFGRNDIADAEPAVPGWRFNVAKLFA
jgi:Uma2 family endonuclease